MVPWVLFPNKPISGKLPPSEEKDEADSIGLHYLESTIDVASGRIGWSVPVTSQALPSAALLLNKLGSVSDWEPCFCGRSLFKISQAGSHTRWQTYLAIACKPGELLALANQICTFSNEMQWLPGCSSPTLAWMTRKKMQRKWTTKAAFELHTGMSCVRVAFLFPMRGSD